MIGRWQNRYDGARGHRRRKPNSYVYGKKVLCGFESWDGWYWFGREKVQEQLSDFGDGRGVPDTIWYGYVPGLQDEWGCFSQAEIESLRPKTREIPKKNLPYSGRRR